MPDSVVPKQSELVPRPDPTSLTTEQLRRELSNLREVIEAEIKSVDVRLDSMDRASALLRSNLDHVVSPEDVSCLRDLMYARIDKSDAVSLEKFSRIDTQFTELDKRTSQVKTASDTAVSTAMTAAEKAVSTAMTAAEKAVTENTKSASLAFDKSEKTTADALKNLDSLFKTEIRATNEKVSMLASRQDRNDGSFSSLVAMGSAVLGVLALIFSAYSAVKSNSQPAPQPVVQYVPAPTTAPTVAPAPITVPR